jgi:hypothetical protein
MILRLAVVFSAIMAMYDVSTALIAKSVSVSYDSFLVPSWVLFFFMGILAGRTLRSWSGILPVAVAATVAATIGWYFAALIGPGYVPVGRRRLWC